MRHRSFARALQSAVLLAILVMAQTAVLVHLDLEESHPGNDACALCAGVATLGAADVGHSVVVFEPHRLRSSPRPGPAPILPLRLETPLARGPPPAS